MRIVAIAAAALIFSFAPAMADEQASDRDIIGKTYSEWAAATNARDIETWSRFLAPDALFLPAGHGALRTHQEIRRFYLELFADPNFSIHCEQLEIEVASSGDMAWSTGECEVTLTGADDRKAQGNSTWAKVWVKQPDGSWKCRVNSWSADPS